MTRIAFFVPLALPIVVLAGCSGGSSTGSGGSQGGVLLSKSDIFPQRHHQLGVFSLPTFPRAADMDGDGILDIIVDTPREAHPLVLLGDGEGRYAKATDPPDEPDFDTVVRPLAIADFNADGVLDVARVEWEVGDDELAIFLGVGDGTLQLNQIVSLNGASRALAVGDLNGDTLPDIAVPDGTGIRLFVSNGNGTFSEDAAAFDDVRALALADLDADGALDLAFGTSFGLKIAFGDGAGGFGLAQTLAGRATDYVEAGDLNGDGRPDLVSAGHLRYSFRVFTNISGNTFSIASHPLTGLPHQLRIADLDGDAFPEILVLHSGVSNLSVFRNDGTGAFPDSDILAYGSVINGLTVARLNADAIPDMAMTNTWTGGVDFLFGQGGGHFFTPPVSLLPADAPVVDLEMGDLNGDGLQDALTVLGNPLNAVRVATQIYPGGFGDPAQFAVGSYPADLALADFNEDSNLDAVVANNASQDLSYLEGLADGGFAPEVRFPTLDFPNQVLVTDVDGDGAPDVLALSGGTSAVHPGNGDGTFGDALPIDTPRLDAGAVGDVTGDGMADLVYVSGFNNLNTLAGNGDGTFADSIVTEFSTTAFRFDIDLADFDADGDLDVVIGSSRGFGSLGPGVSVLFNDGRGSFADLQQFGERFTVLRIFAADVNGDTLPDIVVPDGTQADTVIFLNEGDGEFADALHFSAIDNVSDAALTDIDGDGLPDLVVLTETPALQVFPNLSGLIGP